MNELIKQAHKSVTDAVCNSLYENKPINLEHDKFDIEIRDGAVYVKPKQPIVNCSFTVTVNKDDVS